MDIAKGKFPQDYYVGGKEKIESEKYEFVGNDPAGDPIYKDSKGKQWYIDRLPPYTPQALLQRPKSHLAKFEYGTDYSHLALSYRRYLSALSGRELSNNNYQINYNLKSENTDNIDLNFLYAYNTGVQDYQKGAKFVGVALQDTIQTKNTSKTLDISNTFKNEFGGSELKTTIGINVLKNDYTKSRHPYEVNYKTAALAGAQNIGVINTKTDWPANTMYPAGDQKFNTIYVDNTLNHGIFDFNFNFNVTKNAFEGEIYDKSTHAQSVVEGKKASLVKQLKSKQISLEQYGKKVSEYDRLLLDIRKQAGCPLFDPDEDPDDPEAYDCEDTDMDKASYKSSANGERRYVNYSFGTSAYLYDLFTPFVSYSKTHRAPNIKEMFLANLEILV